MPAAEPSAPESLVFIGKTADQATAQLLRVPSSPPAVSSATREVTYVAGQDFEWSTTSRELRLKAGTRIPFLTPAELYPPANAPQAYRHRRNSDEWMLFGPGRYFHDRQCVAEYDSADPWQPPVSLPSSDVQLGRFRTRLRSQQSVTMVVLGDSISTEADASSLANAPPYQPGYPQLVVESLRHEFKTEVRLVNLSVGGMDSKWGVTQVDKVVSAAPDLVLIAFGMNDASGRRTPEEFAALTQQIVSPVLTALPECEVLLVSSMTANSEWVHSAPELYGQYAQALAGLQGPRVGFADVTTVWQAIDVRKRHLDLTGNGLNHPNDYGHRIYAEVVLAAIGDARWLRPVALVSDFTFPWNERAAPRTTFRALTNDDRLHFRFDVDDAGVIVASEWTGESTVDGEDRVELFIAQDESLADYWCLEIDAAGRVHDYHARPDRQFNNDWKCAGLETSARRTAAGYEVQGTVPLATLASLLGRPIHRGSEIHLGLFRADFSGASPETRGAANDNWISWVRPATQRPDFHVPSAFRVFRLP